VVVESDDPGPSRKSIVKKIGPGVPLHRVERKRRSPIRRKDGSPLRGKLADAVDPDLDQSKRWGENSGFQVRKDFC
jgi:hypothetical protein